MIRILPSTVDRCRETVFNHSICFIHRALLLPACAVMYNPTDDSFVPQRKSMATERTAREQLNGKISLQHHNKAERGRRQRNQNTKSRFCQGWTKMAFLDCGLAVDGLSQRRPSASDAVRPTDDCGGVQEMLFLGGPPNA